MVISNIRVVNQEDICDLRADVLCDAHWVWGDAPFELWYRFPVDYASYLNTENGDPFLAAFLVPAMALGERLIIEAPISEKLFDALAEIQAIYHCWDKRLKLVDVEAGTRVAEKSNFPSGNGLFFSLGVDSSYSLLKNVNKYSEGRGAITHLINILGFDIYLWEEDRYPSVQVNVERVARKFEKEFVPVVTNLRDFSDRIVDWVLLYHGAALASVGLALEKLFGCLHIAASSTYDQLYPLGSHPLLDPLWSNELVDFIHDGCEAGRLDKIRLISESSLLLNTLRVCGNEELADIYNCGCCEKCVRAAIGLYVVDALDRCETLPNTIDTEVISSIPARRPGQRNYCKQLIGALGDSVRDRAIKTALIESLDRGVVV